MIYYLHTIFLKSLPLGTATSIHAREHNHGSSLTVMP